MMLERISQMDENRNGVIEPDEMQNSRRGFFLMAAAREAGMDPTQPISVERLKAAIQNSPRFNGENPAANPAATPGAAATPKPEDKAAAKKPPIFSFPSNVPGFGLPTDAMRVQGFGDVVAASSPTSASTTTSASSSTTPAASAATSTTSSTPSSGSTSSEATPSQEERVRNFADAYLKQRDTDKSGALEKAKDEWKDIRGDPEQIDADHNGVITLDELIQRFSNRQRFGGGGGGGGNAAGGGNQTAGNQGGGDSAPQGNKPPAATSSAPAAKAKRFLTATERLPADLPGWFKQYDTNGDGQVSMSEYSTTWTEGKVAEFAKYDTDHDGFITPQECLKVEKKK
jgi:hypothetical protein